MKNLLSNVAKFVVSEIKESALGTVRFIKDSTIVGISGAGYFVAASEKVPDITQGEQVVLAAAFGAATKFVVDVGAVAGHFAYQAADYVVQPDEQTSRAGCFAGNLAGGMAGAVMATTLAFNTIDDRPQDIAEFFEHSENKAEQTEIMPSQGQ